MPRLKKHVAGEGGWSDWDWPIMTGYRMACCDCGLVHDMEFQAIKVTKSTTGGVFEYEDLDRKKYRVAIRARRNNRSTAQVRRKS